MEFSRIPKNRQLPDPLGVVDVDYDAYLRLADIKANIIDFVNNGNNLYITSSTTGNGKTSWAIKLMTKYFDSIWYGNGFKPRGVFIHVPTFILKCKDFDNKDSEFIQMRNMLSDIDLVVWDDIASTNLTSYDFSQLLCYLDARALNGKANIFTGNIVRRDDLTKALGSKITSRIWGNSTEIIEFKGGDNR